MFGMDSGFSQVPCLSLLLTLKGLVFGGAKKAETNYKHKTKLNNK